MIKAEVDVGSQIRAYRKRKNISLIELSRLTGIAASNLSSIELNKTSPTLSTMVKIAAAFDMKIGPFLDEALYRKAVICRGSDFEHHPEVQTVKGRRPLTQGITLNRMDASIIDLKPSEEAEPVETPGTDRFVYCLQGEFTATVDTDVFHLRSGDSLYLLPEAVAFLRASGEGKASALIVNTPRGKVSAVMITGEYATGRWLTSSSIRAVDERGQLLRGVPVSKQKGFEPRALALGDPNRMGDGSASRLRRKDRSIRRNVTVEFPDGSWRGSQEFRSNRCKREILFQTNLFQRIESHPPSGRHIHTIELSVVTDNPNCNQPRNVLLRLHRQRNVPIGGCTEQIQSLYDSCRPRVVCRSGEEPIAETVLRLPTIDGNPPHAIHPREISCRGMSRMHQITSIILPPRDLHLPVISVTVRRTASGSRLDELPVSVRSG